jgi:hypothetical protein
MTSFVKSQFLFKRVNPPTQRERMNKVKVLYLRLLLTELLNVRCNVQFAKNAKFIGSMQVKFDLRKDVNVYGVCIYVKITTSGKFLSVSTK